MHKIKVNSTMPLLFFCVLALTCASQAEAHDRAEPHNHSNIWQHISTGINNVGPSRFYADPHDSNRLWGSVYAGGLWYSDDGGVNWISVSDSEDDLVYANNPAMGFHPTDYRRFIVVASGKLLQTTDRGHTWTRLNPAGLPAGRIYDLTRHPGNPNLFYVLVGGAGVFKTTDGGHHFADITAPAFTSEMHASTRMAIHPGQPDTLIVSSYSGGIYKSTDAGATWSAITGGTGTGTIKARARYNAVDFDPTRFENSSTSFYRLYAAGYSAIGGTRQQFICYNDTLMQNGWTCPSTGAGTAFSNMVGRKINFSQTGDHSFSIIAAQNDNKSHLLKFTASNSVVTVHVGPIVDRASTEAIYHGKNNTILIGGSRILQHSIDGGRTVQNLAQLPGSNDGFVTTNPLNHRYIAAPTYYSKNRGNTWQRYQGLNDNVHNFGFSSFEFSATDKNTCFGFAHNYDTELEDFFVSDNGCETFRIQSSLDAGGNNSVTLVVDPDNNQVLYTGHYRQGVYKSIDGGLTWAPKNNGFATSNVWAEQLLIDPRDSNVLYAGLAVYGSTHGIYKTVDGGENWFPITNGILTSDIKKFWARAGSLEMDSANPDHLCAIPGDDVDKINHLYCSNDGGANWSLIANDLPPTNSYRSLTIDPRNSDRMWVLPYDVLTFSKGVYYTEDAGNTWLPLNAGLARGDNFPYTNDMAVSYGGPIRLYLSTLGKGLYQYKSTGHSHNSSEEACDVDWE